MLNPLVIDLIIMHSRVSRESQSHGRQARVSSRHGCHSRVSSHLDRHIRVSSHHDATSETIGALLRCSRQFQFGGHTDDVVKRSAGIPVVPMLPVVPGPMDLEVPLPTALLPVTAVAFLCIWTTYVLFQKWMSVLQSTSLLQPTTPVQSPLLPMRQVQSPLQSASATL